MVLFSKRIKELRKEAGLTQQQLGDKLNVTKGSICSYENGTRMASIDILIEISNLFKTTILDIITYDHNSLLFTAHLPTFGFPAALQLSRCYAPEILITGEVPASQQEDYRK